jgi:predicted phosphate transport protein (TIGR00153 family)
MVLARLLPNDARFFQFFRAAADNAVEVAQQLLQLLQRYEDVERKTRRIRDLEHRGDEITHQLYSALNSTFVTPLDREDIRDLAGKLDDFVDRVEEAARRLRLYRIDQPTELARLLGRIIGDQAVVIAQAVSLLEHERNSEALMRHIVEINRLEDEGDDALDRALESLYDHASDVAALVTAHRWGEIYGLLEESTDRGEAVANTLEGIRTKYA